MDCSPEIIEKRTKALNLWDIEKRIREIHIELEEMHNQKELLLKEKNSSLYTQNPAECPTYN